MNMGMETLELRQESAGFMPRGKFHLVADSRSAALCGAKPRSMVWNVSANRAEFERLCPERICKTCARKGCRGDAGTVTSSSL